MGSRPFYVAAARDGEPRHSLLSAGKELLPQELIKNQWAEQDAPQQRTAEKKQAKTVRAEIDCPGQQVPTRFGVDIRGVRIQLPPREVCPDLNLCPWGRLSCAAGQCQPCRAKGTGTGLQPRAPLSPKTRESCDTSTWPVCIQSVRTSFHIYL